MELLNTLINMFFKTRDITFNVAGVTFKSGRKSRQTILKQIKFREPPFDKRLEYKLEEYDFEGEPAISVIVNDVMIGSVPREKLDFFFENVDKMIKVKDIKIVGGGTSVHGEKLSYGAKVTVTMKN